MIIYDKPVEKLNLNSDSYEVVSAYEVLSQMKDPKKVMFEVYRILKPQGVLLVREFNSVFHMNLLGFFDMKLFSFFNLKPGVMHNFNFSKRSLSALLKNAGFKDIQIINSKSTKGDPYGTGGKLGCSFVSVFKTMYHVFAQIIYYASFGNFCIGSSLIVIARK